MSFLLDTNVVSEPVRPQPNEAVLEWFASVSGADLAISVITLGELRRGSIMLPQGPKRQMLDRFVRGIERRYGSNVLPIDVPIIMRWSMISAENSRRGIAAAVPDELIAATALAYDLTLVTRNTRHFEHAGVRLLDPWRA